MGFMKKNETTDSSYILKTTLAYAKRKKLPMFIATLDVTQAFYNINKIKLLKNSDKL